MQMCEVSSCVSPLGAARGSCDGRREGGGVVRSPPAGCACVSIEGGHAGCALGGGWMTREGLPPRPGTHCCSHRGADG